MTKPKRVRKKERTHTTTEVVEAAPLIAAMVNLGEALRRCANDPSFGARITKSLLKAQRQMRGK